MLTVLKTHCHIHKKGPRCCDGAEKTINDKRVLRVLKYNVQGRDHCQREATLKAK